MAPAVPNLSEVGPIKLLLTALGAFLVFKLLKGVWSLIKPRFSRAYAIPGPPSPSFFFGHFRQIGKAENSVLHEGWVEEYGHVIRYKGVLNSNRVMTSDLRALSYILQHNHDYPKPDIIRKNLAGILGKGLLFAEGDEHTLQRRIMNPSFSTSHIRELTEIIVEKANQLCDTWLDLTSNNNNEPIRLDALSWLSKTTLDVIGLAGFDYEFNALRPDGRPNELNDAFNTLFDTSSTPGIIQILSNFFPILGHIPTKRKRQMARAQNAMRRIGLSLIASKKQAILAQASEKHEKAEGTQVRVGRGDVHGRDLLSLLLKANMGADVPERERLSDEDVLGQVPTFLIAGHETSSSATMWALFALSIAPVHQSKLREELLAFPSDTPTMDDLLGPALPFLDAVVRETLRVHAPVSSTIRVTEKPEDDIPLSKPFTDRYGKVHTSIPVNKGDAIFIPILLINRAKEIWGEDALEFNPERWFNLPEAALQIPHVWGNTMSFIAGPRGCIGYKFAVVEIKALLFALVRTFDFELAVPKEDIQKKSAIVQRPVIRSDPSLGNQMPLLVKPHGRG